MHAVFRFHKGHHPDYDSWGCEECEFTGNLWDAVKHAVRHQFIVPR